jgi:protein TonB
VEAGANQSEENRVAAKEAAAKQAEIDRVAAEEAVARQAEADLLAAEKSSGDRAATIAVGAGIAAAQTDSANSATIGQASVKPDTATAAAGQADSSPDTTDAITAELDTGAANTANPAIAPQTSTAATETESIAAAKTTAPETVSIRAVKRIHYVGPKYPRAAQRRDITGWVDLAFTVTTAGEVAEIEVLNAEPETIFDKAAMRAVEQWRFEPATEDDVPVEKRIALRLSFNLQ